MAAQTYIDIANRACQHMGVRTIDPTEGFNEDSVQAHEISVCYDTLRLAELRRALWRFSTRKAVLRPISKQTMLIAPPLWSSLTTYFSGAIVQTVDGAFWTSTSANNLGNPPGGSELWDGFFGPMTCELWVSSTSEPGIPGYYSGDVVYTVAPNGIPSVFMSLRNQNNDTPGVADAWAATIVCGSNTQTKYYFQDQVVLYSGVLYQSLIDLNGGNVPGLAPAPWAAGTTYAAGAQVAGSDAVVYTSLAAGNVGNNPAADANAAFWTQGGLSNPAPWAAGTTYAAGAQVAASDGIIYSSLVGSNLAHNPAAGVSPTWWVSTGAYAPWTTAITNSYGSESWNQLPVALTKLILNYPIGSGPSEDSFTSNVYHLPSGFMREAPQEPKAGQTSILGAATNLLAVDWTFEGDFFTTDSCGPIVFRFVADIRNVAEMDAMFVEGLGARIAMECVERVTSSTSKLQALAQVYKSVMGDARTVDGIERGFTEAALDDYIACRY